MRTEGEKLAGGLTQLAQRASVYRHIYRASGGNHIFPLIAAHGALWARGYFRWALALGRKLAWQYAWNPALQRRQLASLDNFAAAFRDINRRVCADTYANFHFTAEYGDHPDAAVLVPTDLLQALNRMHCAQRAGRTLSTPQKQEIFTAHFLNEQQHVVSPADIRKEVVNVTQTRRQNREKVRDLFSSKTAQNALKKAGIDPGQVQAGISTLSDAELARLAARADKAQADFAAGRISDRDLIIILVVIAVIILIIVAVD